MYSATKNNTSTAPLPRPISARVIFDMDFGHLAAARKNCGMLWTSRRRLHYTQLSDLNVNKQDQKRRYFRVPYPEAAKPPFEHDTGKTYKVVDISERGMKIDTAGDAELDIGMHVTGTVIFHDNTSVRVAGNVLRIDRDGAAIELANSLNVGNLLREQTFIRKKFPMFLMDKSRMG